MSRLHCAVEGLVISLIVRYLFLDAHIYQFTILLFCQCVSSSTKKYVEFCKNLK
jgi:hypothetical protein